MICPPFGGAKVFATICTIEHCDKHIHGASQFTLSITKSHNIHMGKNRKLCQDLRVHDSKMNESRSEKYLGNIIHNSGSVKPNVAKRLSKGWGRINEILAIIKEAPRTEEENN